MFDRKTMKKRYGIALLPSTRDAMRAETQAKAQHMKVRIIPTPGRIRANCGFSLRYELVDEQRVLLLLEQLCITCDGMYEVEQEGLQTAYTPRRKE